MVAPGADIRKAATPPPRQLLLDLKVIAQHHGGHEMMVVQDLRGLGRSFDGSYRIREMGSMVKVSADSLLVKQRCGPKGIDHIGQELVVIDSESSADDCISTRPWRPANTQAGGKIAKRRIMVQIGTYREFGVPQGVGQKNVSSVLVVEERAEFIAESEIHSEVWTDPVGIVDIKAQKSLPPKGFEGGVAGIRIRQCRRVIFGSIRGAQKAFQAVE